jgi:hypothetical protein
MYQVYEQKKRLPKTSIEALKAFLFFSVDLKMSFIMCTFVTQTLNNTLMKVAYEWCYEVTDEHGDIIDSNFADKLSEFSKNEEGELLLVRNEGDEINGVEDRQWAYVKDGKLPFKFSDARNVEIEIDVPKRFFKELENYLK